MNLAGCTFNEQSDDEVVTIANAEADSAGLISNERHKT